MNKTFCPRLLLISQTAAPSSPVCCQPGLWLIGLGGGHKAGQGPTVSMLWVPLRGAWAQAGGPFLHVVLVQRPTSLAAAVCA